MRKIVSAAFVSLDGIMQSPGGPSEDPSGGFQNGGWVVGSGDEEFGAIWGKLFEQPFDLLLGRKTYDIFAAHWPFVGPDDPIGQRFNPATKYVATRNSDFKTTWENTTLLVDDVVDSLKTLKQGNGPLLLTQGSAAFLNTLFANGLVDELVVAVFPVLLGSGKRLFTDGGKPSALALQESRVTSMGTMVNRYTIGGKIRTTDSQFDPPTAAELDRRRNLT